MKVYAKLLGALIAILINLECRSIVAAQEDQNRPNVLFILVDDFGWHDVGYNGSTFYETPAMDALSKQWMRFDNCYTPSPMCSPTRVSILTGKNPARHGVTQWLPGVEKAYTRKGEKPRVFCPLSKSTQIADDEVTIGKAFQNAGYATAFYGKWHMGSFEATGGPSNHGYDSQRAVIESNRCKMFFPFWDHPEYFPKAKEGDNYTDLLTDAAIEYVTQKRDAPFYLHLSHFAMHAPIGSKPKLREHFQKKADQLPAVDDDWISDDRYAHKPYKRRQDDAEYAGELATLDQNIGKLIEALKTAGLYDDTIIILTGDNGGRSCKMQGNPTSNEPLRTGKTYVFEGGIKTPLLIHWPGKTKPGARSGTPVMSTDFFPTLLEMTGQSLLPDQHVDGTSFVPLLEGNKLDRSPLVWHFPHYQGEGSYPASAIRVGDYKLIHNYHHDDVLLYDVVGDPKGRIFVNRAKIVGKPIEEGWDDGKFTEEDVVRLHKDKPQEGHFKNFYRCIVEGGLPMSDVFTHVQAMNTCHLAAIAARLGKVIHWDPKAEKIVGDELAQSFVARERREGFDILSV